MKTNQKAGLSFKIFYKTQFLFSLSLFVTLKIFRRLIGVLKKSLQKDQVMVATPPIL